MIQTTTVTFQKKEGRARHGHASLVIRRTVRTPPLVWDLGRCYLPPLAVYHHYIEALRQVDDRFADVCLLLQVQLIGGGIYI